MIGDDRVNGDDRREDDNGGDNKVVGGGGGDGGGGGGGGDSGCDGDNDINVEMSEQFWPLLQPV